MGSRSCAVGRTCATTLGLLAIICLLQAAAGLDTSKWNLPDGFFIEDYAQARIYKARSLAVSGNSVQTGPVITYVSSMQNGSPVPLNITALVDLNGTGRADYTQLIVAVSPMPNGIAWFKNDLYIAALDSYKSCILYRLKNVDSYARSKQTATIANLDIILDNLPIDYWHGWKFIRFGPDGKLYLPIGANANVCEFNFSQWDNGTDASGTFYYSRAYSGNPYFVHKAYRKNAQSPIWQYASIYRMNPDGTGIELFAKGVRNTVGFDWHPTSKAFYFTDNGRDDWGKVWAANGTVVSDNGNITENLPDCELNWHPGSAGAFFGFPYCHTSVANPDGTTPYVRPAGNVVNRPDPHVNVNSANMQCNNTAKFTPAIQPMGPHTAPLGMRFYKWSASQVNSWPPEYNNNILVALHGSWNRFRPIGAKVMRVVLNTTNTVKSYTSFLAGGVPGDTGVPSGPDPPVQRNVDNYIGRPVDVEQLPDGSMLVSDDFAHGVYRIKYIGAVGCHTKKLGGTCQRDNNGQVALVPERASLGCRVDLGELGVKGYRRCYRFDMTGQKDWVIVAYNLKLNQAGKIVMEGALVAVDYATINADGWLSIAFPVQGSYNMHPANAVFVRPNTATNIPIVNDYYMTNKTYTDFKPSCTAAGTGGSPKCSSDGVPEFNNKTTTIRAVQSNRALIATFEVFPSTVVKPSLTKLGILMAMGDKNQATGAPLAHWTKEHADLPINAADVGATATADAPLVNPPKQYASNTAPPSPDPYSDPQILGNCTLNGLQYDSCSVVWQKDGTSYYLPMVLYFTVLPAQNTIKGGIRVDTRSFAGVAGSVGWAAVAAGTQMSGADAVFVWPDANGGASGDVYSMGYTTLTAPKGSWKKVFFGTDPGTGDLLAQYETTWAPASGGKMPILFGGGPYVVATGTKNKHISYPRQACVGPAGVLSMATAAGC